jgi:hypothetical protein
MTRLTELTAGHDVWNSVYSRPDVYLWLFSHRLKANGQAQTPPAPKTAATQGTATEATAHDPHFNDKAL